MTLLVDLGACSCEHTNDALEHLFKAQSQDPHGDERGIWAPHQNPFLTRHVEDVTRRLQAILQAIQDGLALKLFGETVGELAKALPPWLGWDDAKFEAVGARLQALPAWRFTQADWMELVDWLLARYLPDSVISSEAEYLTVRAALLGKIEAAWAAKSNEPPPPDLLEAWSRLTPTRFAAVPPRVLTEVEWSILGYAKERAATNIGMVAAATRARMRAVVLEHVQAQVLGQKDGTPKYLRTRLFDEFGSLNKDCRRIAVTEAGECVNQGFIAAQKIGSRVKRREAYLGACEFCQSINGKEFRVISPAEAVPSRDGWTAVWVGKDNVGRSASPRKRVGNLLIERPESERWWPAAGTQHPHCRGSWTVLPDTAPNVSPEFASYMDGLAARFRAG